MKVEAATNRTLINIYGVYNVAGCSEWWWSRGRVRGEGSEKV